MSLFRKTAFATAVALTSIGVLPGLAVATPADEAAFLNDINALRVSKGVGPLTSNDDMVVVARRWAEHMASVGQISHNPNLAAQAAPGWSKLGENVGVGGDEPQLHQAFVNSPGHYANLVDGAYSEAGIAVVDSGGRKWVVEAFRASKSGTTAQAKAPAPSPAPSRPAPVAAPRARNGSIENNAKSLRALVAIDG